MVPSSDQSLRAYEQLTTIPAVVGLLLSVQNISALPRIYRNKYACSIRFYDFAMPYTPLTRILYGFLLADLIVLAFRMAENYGLLDEDYKRKVIKNDELVYFLVLVYILAVGLRLLFCLSV